MGTVRSALRSLFLSNEGSFAGSLVAGYLAVAGVLAAMPRFGPSRFAIALIVAVVGPAGIAYVERRVSPHRRDTAHSGAVIALILVHVHFIPQAWYGATVIVAMVVSTMIVAAGPKVTMMVGAVAVATLGVSGWIHGLEHWPTTIVAFVGLPPISGALWIFRQRAEKGDRRLSELAGSVQALFVQVRTTGVATIVDLAGPTADMLGYEPEMLIGQPFDVLFHDDLQHSADASRIWRSAEGEARLRHRLGMPVWVQYLTSSEADGTVRIVAFDISELHQTRAALRRYEHVVNRLRAAVLVGMVDRYQRFTVLEANPAANQLLGFDPAALAPDALGDAMPWIAQQGVASAAERVQATGEPAELDRVSTGPSVDSPTVDSPTVDSPIVDIDLARLPDGSVALTLTDVTDQIEAERTIRHQAEHDPLTGLANRSVLTAELKRRLEVGRRRPRGFALLIFDLDRFKEINDTLGHHFGDKLLQRLGARLSTAARPADLVARLGGDEFAIVLDGADELDDVVEVARRVAQLCSRPVEIDRLTVAVGVSIGIAMAPDHGSQVSTLMRRADAAMYNAKRAGHAYRVFDPMQEDIDVERIMLSSELERAFARGEFQLWAQPKINLHTAQIIGVEGLVRWQHPTLGTLPPGRFLDLVEVSGRLGDLAATVLRQGIEAAGRLPKHVPGAHVAVNLSVRDLVDDAMPTLISDLLTLYDVSPRALFLEITEGSLMEELAVTEPILEALGRMQIALSIDDFGTGHSSLARLRRLPVSEVKIDRSFVQELSEDSNDTIVVRSIIDLAHNLGLHATAEGVESPEAAELLTDFGCDAAQGFLWGRPVPLAEAIENVGQYVDHVPETLHLGHPAERHLRAVRGPAGTTA